MRERSDDPGATWRVKGSSGRETTADDVEKAGHLAWEMAQDDDAVNVKVGR